ncbi:MAG: Hsp20/alpha crystallin family protein [Fibrobacter sp.]|jgi:HSP20 family protein|nr:Hsp20/alpha crystallin family protein [Fibrobacter sp.]
MLWATDPFREIERMRREMDRVFSRIPFLGATEYEIPLVNLYDNKDSIILVAEIPGIPKDQINLNFSDGNLVISGKRELSRYGKSELLRQEQPEGEFEKSVRIPVRIDSTGIKAKFEDGMLTVVLPKSEEAKPKQINIES